MDAVILAASPNQGALRIFSDTAQEAMIPIGSRPMVDFIVQAILKTDIRRIVLVGCEALASRYQHEERIQFTSGGRNHLDSLENGFSTLEQPSDRVLVITGDIPLVTGDILQRFIDCCNADHNAPDLIYPIVPAEAFGHKYPQTKRTYLKLKDGKFTGGNVFYVNPAIFYPTKNKLQRIIAKRKSPLRLANEFGFLFLIRLLLGRIDTAQAANTVSELFGITGYALITTDCELAIDVDKPADMQLVRDILTSPQH